MASKDARDVQVKSKVGQFQLSSRIIEQHVNVMKHVEAEMEFKNRTHKQS